MEELASDVQPNDLAVAANGFVYFTETGKKQVTLLDLKTRQVKAVDTQESLTHNHAKPEKKRDLRPCRVLR